MPLTNLLPPDLDKIKFVNTRYFSEAAIHKEKHGRYCNAPFGSSEYNNFWKEQDKRCLQGYSVGGIRITGYHYWFLNFKQLEIVIDPHKQVSRKKVSFPRFWGQHYHFFHYLEYAETIGKHMVILKPRGTGFSELLSSTATRNYTLIPKSKSFFFASNIGYLTKDGVLTKCWDQLEFLNQETERGYLHLRQKKDQDLHKRASLIKNTRNGNIEKGYKSEIIGRVIDHPRKVRGARTGTDGKVYFEEGGSFPHVGEAVMTARPLVEQGGTITAQMILWGTGGEKGPGIAGLERIFYNPDAYNMLSIPNIWDIDRPGTHCGYFFPVEACMDKFMDNDGNSYLEGAIQYQLNEREKIRQAKPETVDKYVAEYPRTPTEALTRMENNDFPIFELQQQLNRITSDKNITGFLKHGWVVPNQAGIMEFRLDPNARPVDEFPHKMGEIYPGCVTVVELPYKDSLGKVPDELYYIILDPYYKDIAPDSMSLGACYVYKATNNISPTEDDLLVAWYVARPKRLEIFYYNLFNIARFYNAVIQSEILGGGKGVFDYAREHKLLHYCAKEPDIVFNKDNPTPIWNRKYFMNVSTDMKIQGITYLSEWLKKPRTLEIDKITGETREVLNLYKIYDKALLQELIRFSTEGNFDRVSSLLLLPFVIKERGEVLVEKQNMQNTEDFWSRNFHSGDYSYHDPYLTNPVNW